ncbi:MAG: sulfotransferase [Candidatus Krumholzibacteriia bacterium]
MSEFELTEAAVLEAAREASGLNDFGGDDFREGLGVLLETYRDTAGLGEKGRKLNFRRVVQLLGSRLRIQEALRKHPEIREREIRSPVYLTGLPRTGTSALFNLLGSDPAARPLLLWEGLFPDPIEGLEPGQPDPRREAVRASYDRMRERNPEWSKIHFASADTPEECVLLMAHAFCDVQMGIEVLMEPYASWFRKQDLRASYSYYRDLLKMLDWQRPGKRWLLKSPAHLWALDVLIEMFPDACIVVTHRNPVEAVASYCSMMEALLCSRGCAPIPNLGSVVLEYLSVSLERGLTLRDASRADRFTDVDYEEFVADPMATAEAIYSYFNLELTPDVERAMGEHVAANPAGRHGEHEYDLAKFGLTVGAVKDRLAGYITRFDLPT